MTSKKRWQQRLGDLGKASQRLKEALAKDSFEDLEKDGVIQRFEFTFELAWKTLKNYLEDQGVIEVSFPKNVLRKAFQDNLIEDGDLWLQMLEDRNLLSHVYEQTVSDRVFDRIKNAYAGSIQTLIKTLTQKQT